MDGRWRKRLHAVDLLALAEEAEDLSASGPSCARGSQALPAPGMELLANLLEGWPSMATRQRHCEPDPRKLRFAPQVGDSIHVHREAPQVTGQLVSGPQRQLVDLAVPLGPGRLT